MRISMNKTRNDLDEDNENDFYDLEIIEIEGEVEIYKENDKLFIVKKGHLN